MSVRISARVWESDLTGSDLLLMLALADHADDEGVCWPSVPKIAVKARMSERTAQRAIKRLTEAGYLAVSRNAGRYGTNRYVVMPGGPAPRYPQVPSGDNVAPLSGDNLTPVTPGDARGVTTGCHPRGDRAMTPESSRNHQKIIKRAGTPTAAAPPQRCPLHRGQYLNHCGPCRAETLAPAETLGAAA